MISIGLGTLLVTLFLGQGRKYEKLSNHLHHALGRYVVNAQALISSYYKSFVRVLKKYDVHGDIRLHDIKVTCIMYMQKAFACDSYVASGIYSCNHDQELINTYRNVLQTIMSDCSI